MPTLDSFYASLLSMVKGSENQQPMPLEAARRTLEQQIQENSPNPNNLQNAQDAFCDFQKERRRLPRNFQPKLKDKPEEMKKRQEYSAKCRDVLMNHAVRMVEQHQIWDAAVGRMNLPKNPDGTAKTVSPRRWMSRLMKMDNSPESIAHNDKVVAMAALAQGDITMEQFRQYRQEAYQKDKTLKKDDIDKLVQDDCNKGVEGLLDILDEMVAEGRRSIPQIKEASMRILSGELDEQQLKEAFDVLESDAAYLMFNGKNTMQDFQQDFKVTLPPEKLGNRSVEWEADSTAPSAYRTMAEQMANPYYAILDPSELWETSSFSLANPAGNEMNSDIVTMFSADAANGIQMAVNNALDVSLAKYEMDAGDIDVNHMSPECTLYKKGDKVVILGTEMPSAANGFAVSICVDKPGLLMKGFDSEIEAQRQACRGVNYGHTSDQFENMQSKLDALAGATLKESPTAEEVEELTRKLTELQKATQVYIDKKERQRHGRPKHEYEGNRMKFAADLKKFTQEKLKNLGYIRSHQVLQAPTQEDAVRTAVVLNEQKDIVREMEDNLSIQDYTKTFRTNYYETMNRVLEVKEKGVALDRDPVVAAQMEVDLDIQLNTMGRKYLAGEVVQELLKMEQQLSGGQEGPMQKLAREKKTGTLVDMVWNSDSFINNVRFEDLSDNSVMDAQRKNNVPKQVAKEIMQNYIRHQRYADGQAKIHQQEEQAKLHQQEPQQAPAKKAPAKKGRVPGAG